MLICETVSGTGAYACQLAKNVFNAGKVITTVSTSKVAKVAELLGEGVVDQSMKSSCLPIVFVQFLICLIVIDYTKEDALKVIPPHSVDFILDTTGQATSFFSLMVPSTSLIISISTTPSGTQLQNSSLMQRSDNARLPVVVRILMNVLDSVRKSWARWYSVDYEYMFLEANAEDLGFITQNIEEGKLVPVVGSRAKFNDIDEVRKICDTVYKGKGGIGKAVIEIR